MFTVALTADLHTLIRSTMAAISLAIIGRSQEGQGWGWPLYIKEFDKDESPEYTNEEDLFGLSSESHSIPSTADGFECSTRQQFILHAALDRFEQLAGPPPGIGWRKQGISGHDGMFVGLLCPVEEMRVYGYVTASKVLILLVVEDEAVPDFQKNVDEEIKSLLIKVHDLYVKDLMNPFKDIGSPIASKRFDENIQEYISTFNQSEGMI